MDISIPERKNGGIARNDWTKARLKSSRANTKSYHFVSDIWSL